MVMVFPSIFGQLSRGVPWETNPIENLTPCGFLSHGNSSHGFAMGTLLSVLVGFEPGTPTYISVSLLTRLSLLSYIPMHCMGS